jgi:cytochrome c-type biogenesis protein CcmH
MSMSIALALIGIVASCAVVLALLNRMRFEVSDESILALAQSGSVRLKELEQRAHTGTLEATAADEARMALLQELLRTDREIQAPRWLLEGNRKTAVVIGLAAIALGCLSLLSLTSGASSSHTDAVSGGSLADSARAQDPDVARLEHYANAKFPRLRATAPMSTPVGLPDVETMIERLADRLQTAPEDAEGWRMLGWSYFHVQQPMQAIEAYARAVALRPQSAQFKSAYAEAMVAAEAGTVTPKAVELFNAALALDPKDAKARYFLALAMDQVGKKQEALDAWLSLQAEPLGDEPWVAELRERTRALAQELNVDLSARIAARQQAANDAQRTDGRAQPTPEQIRGLQALPADQREEAIRGMVEGLADRLKSSPRDEQGWLRLIRSRVVLGEPLAAREALTRALGAFSDDAAAVARITTAAKELGVTND